MFALTPQTAAVFPSAFYFALLASRPFLLVPFFSARSVIFSSSLRCVSLRAVLHDHRSRHGGGAVNISAFHGRRCLSIAAESISAAFDKTLETTVAFVLLKSRKKLRCYSVVIRTTL
jgi:hypothetical protein